MRLAKGINQTLTTGFTHEYLQLFQYNTTGAIIRVDNPPTANPVTFELRLNGSVIIPTTSLTIGVGATVIDVPYSIILYKNDVLTFECISCIDSGVGNPVFFGIY